MLTVATLVEQAAAGLGLSYVFSGSANENSIAEPRIQKPGLALTGYARELHPQRLIVIGGTEVDYLESVSAEAAKIGVDNILKSNPACVVVTRGLSSPAILLSACKTRNVPLLSSSQTSADFIVAVTKYLRQVMAPRKTVHGVLLDVLGVGVLIVGKSGLGKSETALDLVVRGHRLVADDVVTIRRIGDSVIGTGNNVLKHRMEIRGLGVLNIKDLFGISSVRDTKKIELVAELMHWDATVGYDRLGVEDRFHDLLGVEVPFIQMPVHPGRNIGILLEVSARNQLLKGQGYHSAREFDKELRARLSSGRLDGVE